MDDGHRIVLVDQIADAHQMDLVDRKDDDHPIVLVVQRDGYHQAVLVVQKWALKVLQVYGLDDVDVGVYVVVVSLVGACNVGAFLLEAFH